MRTLTGGSKIIIPNSLTFSPDKQILASGDWDNKLLLWRMLIQSQVQFQSPSLNETSLIDIVEMTTMLLMLVRKCLVSTSDQKLNLQEND